MQYNNISEWESSLDWANTWNSDSNPTMEASGNAVSHNQVDQAKSMEFETIPVGQDSVFGPCPDVSNSTNVLGSYFVGTTATGHPTAGNVPMFQQASYSSG